MHTAADISDSVQEENAPFKPLNDSVWELYAPADGKDYDTEVILFHDMQHGDFKDAWRTTWTNEAGKCWPREFWKDKFPTTRMLSVSYDSSVDTTSTHGRMDLELIAERVLIDLFLAGVGQKANCPLMFVGHGLGSFVIKSLIVRASRISAVDAAEKEKAFLNNVGGFVFYSPYNQGVRVDIYNMEFDETSPLKIYQGNNKPQLSRVNNSFEWRRNRYQKKQKSKKDVDLWRVLTIWGSQPIPEEPDQGGTPRDVVVGEESARYGCDKFLFVGAHHFNVCRHETTLESGFQLATEWLEDIRRASQSSRKADVHRTSNLEFQDPGEIIPGHLFNRLFPNKDPFYSYESFVEAIRTFNETGFGVTGNHALRRRELAAFLAHIDHGTSGLIYKEERNPWDKCCLPSSEFPCSPGKSYHGRGPMQISWNYNYKSCGQAIDEDLVTSPEKVSEDPVIAFKSAIWFWCKAQWNKPSCHSVMTGLWVPMQDDIAANRLPGFGVTTNIINGGYECGMKSPQAESRLHNYKKFCSVFGVEPGENLDTSNQHPFG